MKYMLLIYSDPAKQPVYGTDEFNDYIGAYQGFTKEAEQAGVLIMGEPLDPIATAQTVRAHDGKVTSIDGPFAETKETLGGFYLLDCKDIDEAKAYAAKIPTAKFGSIEVRAVMNLG
ncbi:MAG: YciI family protein [Granulosicoccus sp.]